MSGFNPDNSPSHSVVPWLFESKPFVDRGLETAERIDVIIPLLHSNSLWEQNLKSYFREIPIGKLIIGDAGCIDGSIEALANFPRVLILDHKSVSTLGKSLALMIEEVSTPEFVYLQSDVALPPNWYEKMRKDLETYDWIGSPMHLCVLADYRNDFRNLRPLAGAQLGKSKAFVGLSDFLDDDFVYRQEDFVLANYAIKNGYKVGNTNDTYHLHQFMRRTTVGEENNIRNINVEVISSHAERTRVQETQLKGMLKYTSPSYELARKEVINIVKHALISDPTLLLSYIEYARQEAPTWINILKRAALRAFLSDVYNRTKSFLAMFKPKRIHILIRLISG